MVVGEIGGGFFCGSCGGFLLVVVSVGFIYGCRRGFLLVILAVVAFLWFFYFLFFEKLLWLLVVGLVVFLMGFSGWYGGGYCDYGGGC